jgi:ribulose-bisphosphate carboxylase large chain
MNHFKPIFPSPGGGMTFDNVPEMARFYGADVMYLMGGNLHKQPGTLDENCRTLRSLVDGVG